MRYIDIKGLKQLIHACEKKGGLEEYFKKAKVHYHIKVPLRMLDYDSLLYRVERVNNRHRRKILKDAIKFGNSELKLFSWTVILYCHSHSVEIHEMINSDFIKIRGIFRHVDSDRIIFQILCIRYVKKAVEDPWSQQELELFHSLVERYQAAQWKTITYQMFKRSDCRFFRPFEHYREKWINYLNPELKKGQWSRQDEVKLMSLVVQHGCRWALIARQFQGTRNQHHVKNHFKKLLKEMKIQKSSIDTKTHKFMLQTVLERVYGPKVKIETTDEVKIQNEPSKEPLELTEKHSGPDLHTKKEQDQAEYIFYEDNQPIASFSEQERRMEDLKVYQQ